MHMRSSPAFVSFVAFASLAGLASSCSSEDAAPLYLDAQYQLRCVDCTPRVPDEPVREIQALDGEQGFEIECFVSGHGDQKELTMSGKYVDPAQSSKSYEFRIARARYKGNDPGSACQVRILESGNKYAGKCTSGTPTHDEPCEVHFERDGDIVNGSVFCNNIPNPSTSPETTRHVVAPHETDQPVKFEIHGCTGL